MSFAAAQKAFHVANITFQFCDECGQESVRLEVEASSRSCDQGRDAETFSRSAEIVSSCSRGVKRRLEAEEQRDLWLEATDEDVSIGRAISAQGDDLSLEDALTRIRMTLTIKKEPIEERLIRCDQIRFSQASCAKRFATGARMPRSRSRSACNNRTSRPEESHKKKLQRVSLGEHKPHATR